MDPPGKPVENRDLLPTRVPRTHRRLWEPGDRAGTIIVSLTCEDGSPSTIHSPYYYP